MKEQFMKDLILIVVTIAFFVFSMAYVRFCEGMK